MICSMSLVFALRYRQYNIGIFQCRRFKVAMSRKRSLSLTGTAIILVVLCLVVLPVRGDGASDQGSAEPQNQGQSSAPSAPRFPKNAKELERMFEQVKDWGHWGPD